MTTAEGIVLSCLRTFNQWIGAEEEDYQIWLNGLIPKEQDEEYMRELTIGEVAIHCLANGIVNVVAKKYPSSSFEGVIAIEVLKGLKEAGFNLALSDVNIKAGEIHYWGLRRHQNRPIWVRRPPNLQEAIQAMVAKGGIGIVDPDRD